jgi:hypothetical protein
LGDEMAVGKHKALVVTIKRVRHLPQLWQIFHRVSSEEKAKGGWHISNKKVATDLLQV